jgi:hypothetical protein
LPHFVGNCGELDGTPGSSSVNIVTRNQTAVRINSYGGWVFNGNTVHLPKDATVTWRLVAGNSGMHVYGASNTFAAGAGGVLNATSASCVLSIAAPVNVTVKLQSHAEFWVDGDGVALPINNMANWQLGMVYNASGPWNVFSVGTCLVPLVVP